MQDMLAKAEAWFESQRREHLAVEVEYRPVGAFLPRTCRATLVIGRWEAVDSSGQIVRIETRDFFIHRDELPQDPKRGDKVALVENGSEQLYEVSIPDGSKAPWRWADRSQTTRRIHTMAVQGSSAVLNSTLLVRAVGVSTAAAITDEQIKMALAADLGQSRNLRKQLVATSAYVYIVLPTSFDEPSISVNGFRSTAWQTTTRSITFDGQAARPYTIYRSTYPITGTALVEVA
jgi:hypothetical protein